MTTNVPGKAGAIRLYPGTGENLTPLPYIACNDCNAAAF